MAKRHASKGNALVFLPSEAKLNWENDKNQSPDTTYQKRRKNCNSKEVAKITKGKYGRNLSQQTDESEHSTTGL